MHDKIHVVISKLSSKSRKYSKQSGQKIKENARE